MQLLTAAPTQALVLKKFGLLNAALFFIAGRPADFAACSVYYYLGE